MKVTSIISIYRMYVIIRCQITIIKVTKRFQFCFRKAILSVKRGLNFFTMLRFFKHLIYSIIYILKNITSVENGYILWPSRNLMHLINPLIYFKDLLLLVKETNFYCYIRVQIIILHLQLLYYFVTLCLFLAFIITIILHTMNDIFLC